jgi:hypothetical protein
MWALGKPPMSRAVTLKYPGWLWVISIGQNIQVQAVLMTSPSTLLEDCGSLSLSNPHHVCSVSWNFSLRLGTSSSNHLLKFYVAVPCKQIISLPCMTPTHHLDLPVYL